MIFESDVDELKDEKKEDEIVKTDNKKVKGGKNK